MMTTWCAFCFLFCAAAVAADSETAPASGLAERVADIHLVHLEKARGNSDLLALPGVLADRKSRRVHVYAQATGVGPQDIVEFLLIAANSGHDYEALATVFAKPSDIHRALTFIGLQPGRPVNAEKLCFWPKGERVIATVAGLPPGSAYGPFGFDTLLLDKVTGEPWIENGLVFVGSEYVDSPDNPAESVYAADIFGPNSIVSTYNEPTTVLDVPRQAPQSVVYGRQKLNSECLPPENVLLEIIVEPEKKDGKKRVVDLELAAQLRAGAEGITLNSLVFDLAGKDKPLRKASDLNGILETFVSLVRDGHDPFVTLRLGDGLPLGAVHELCTILHSIETERGIRMEPPAEGQLYFKAFLPDEAHRDRKKRISQPWELHLTRNDTCINGNLIHIEQIWNDDSIYPDLKLTERHVSTPAELRKGLDEMGASLPVILVYSPPDVTHGQLMSFLAPARTTHPVIHVFLAAGE